MFRVTRPAVKIGGLTIVAAGMCGPKTAAAQPSASCPPKPMLKVIHEAKRARVIRLGARADRDQNPLERERFLGFEPMRVIEIEPKRMAPLVRVFERAECYACGERPAAAALTVAPVSMRFEID
jgi:hypothetical protein